MSKIINFNSYNKSTGKRERFRHQGFPMPMDTHGDVLEFATMFNTFNKDCLTQIGFDDSSHWLLGGKYRASFIYKGIGASPHVVAYKRFDNVLRVVTLKAGSIPGYINYDTSLMTRYQTLIVASAMRRQNIELHTFESWVVYDCGSRFVLDPIDRQDWEQIRHLVHAYRQRFNIFNVRIEDVVRDYLSHCA